MPRLRKLLQAMGQELELKLVLAVKPQLRNRPETGPRRGVRGFLGHSQTWEALTLYYLHVKVVCPLFLGHWTVTSLT